jgi:CDP-glucose 4,6-dehydratase
MGKKVLVTGATGFIGSHLVHLLKGENHVVLIARDLTMNMWSPWLTEALRGCTMIHGDILDSQVLRRVLTDYDIQDVYHLASQAIVKNALRDPTNTFQTNVMGTVSVLEACRSVGIERILVMSTDKVYGSRIDVKEDCLLAPTGIYETSKVCEDSIAQSFRETYHMPIFIARACNCYGYDLNSRIVPNTIIACMNGEHPIIYTNNDPIRQYIFVDDLVDALKFINENLVASGAYNIGTDCLFTQSQLVKKICMLFDTTPIETTRATCLPELADQSVDWTRLRESGWTPAFNMDDGLRITIGRFKKFGIPKYLLKAKENG